MNGGCTGQAGAKILLVIRLSVAIAACNKSTSEGSLVIETPKFLNTAADIYKVRVRPTCRSVRVYLIID